MDKLSHIIRFIRPYILYNNFPAGRLKLIGSFICFSELFCCFTIFVFFISRLETRLAEIKAELTGQDVQLVEFRDGELTGKDGKHVTIRCWNRNNQACIQEGWGRFYKYDYLTRFPPSLEPAPPPEEEI